MKVAVAFQSLTLMLLVCASSFSQGTTGTILGSVRDQSGAAVPGVTITVADQATTLSRTTLSNEVGDYTVSLLPPGVYSITAELAGFRKAIQSDVALQVAQKARIDLVMEVGAADQSVSVTARAALTDTASAEIGTVVDTRKVHELPLNGRNFFGLTLLSPGSVQSRSTLVGQGLWEGAVHVSGAGSYANNYQIEGIDNNEHLTTAIKLNPSVDAIQEFRMQSSNYSAEYGRGGGAQVNIAIRSGTNEFHGTVFEFLRNDNLDARNFFDRAPKRPEFKLNDFGGTFGGPIVRNRTFFFFSYEGLRSGKGLTSTQTVPTLGHRQGDLSGGPVIYDPATTRPDPNNPGAFIRDPFPNNLIPLNRINSTSRNMLIGDFALYPAPNSPGVVRNFSFAPTQINTKNQFVSKITHRLSDKDNLNLAWIYEDHPSIQPFSFTAPLPGFQSIINFENHNISLSEVHTFSPRVVNELRIGGSLYRDFFGEERSDIPYPDALPIYGVVQRTGSPRVSIAGFSITGTGTNLPQGRSNNNYQITDSLTYIVREHVVKVGIDIRRAQQNGGFIGPTNSRGMFSFTPRFTTDPQNRGTTGQAMADFLLGYPTVAVRGLGDLHQYFRNTNWGGYFQDDWKITPDLTLNVGLRYEYNSPPNEIENKIANFWPDRYATRTASAVAPDYPGLVYPHDPGTPDSGALFYGDKNNFAPRLGFAYRVFGRDDFVIRGGAGIFYYMIPQQYPSSQALNLPFLRTETFQSDLTFPNLQFPDPFPAALASFSVSPSSVIDKDYRDGYIQQFSLGIQKSLPRWDLVIQPAYVGSKGTKIIEFRQINQPRPGPGPIQLRRPFPEYGPMSMLESSSSSTYHSFQLRAEKRMSKGLSFLSSYTWAKLIDWGYTSMYEGNQTVIDPYNVRASMRGRGTSDLRHRYVLSYLYELPFGRGKALGGSLTGPLEKIISGWLLTGISTFQSGFPLTATLSFDNTNTGGLNIPDRITNPQLPSSERSIDRWFDTGALALPPQFVQGNAGRNYLDAPGYKNFDIGLIKNMRVGEDTLIQFRAEFFNAFNNVNFDPPDMVFGVQTFGRISSAGLSREIQFGLKVQF